jgi:hypothetical protein
LRNQLGLIFPHRCPACFQQNIHWTWQMIGGKRWILCLQTTLTMATMAAPTDWLNHRNSNLKAHDRDIFS